MCQYKRNKFVPALLYLYKLKVEMLLQTNVYLKRFVYDLPVTTNCTEV